jgi:alkylhydroperoxidase family enzyme
MQHHLASSKRAGLTEEDWKALKDPKSVEFGAPTDAALVFAEKLTRAPGEIKDEDIAALKHYFSDEQIVDLDLLVGLANLTNRFTDPLGLELEFAAEKV